MQGIEPVTRTYNTLMIACNTSGQWQEALRILTKCSCAPQCQHNHLQCLDLCSLQGRQFTSSPRHLPPHGPPGLRLPLAFLSYTCSLVLCEHARATSPAPATCQGGRIIFCCLVSASNSEECMVTTTGKAGGGERQVACNDCHAATCAGQRG